MEEFLKQAIKGEITERELRVLIAYKLGYTEVYDIQVLTGLRKNIVEETLVAQGVQPYINISTSNNTNTVKSAHGVQTNSNTPPQEILTYLHTKLNLPIPSLSSKSLYVRSLSTAKQLYVETLARHRGNQKKTLDNIKDCIDAAVAADKFIGANYPIGYLKNYILPQYYSTLPKMPPEVWEVEHYMKIRMGFNYVTRDWYRTQEQLA